MVDYRVVALSPSEIMSPGFRRRQRPSVFVAYRFHDRDSVDFRSRLEAMMAHHPSLSHVAIHDGHVQPGVLWADTVRKLIGRSRLVIADLTGPSRDVMFEVGFGYGLRKPIVPVVGSSARLDVPQWLTSIQAGRYTSDIELNALLAAVDFNVTRAGSHRPPRSPEGVPGLAVWLGRADWAEESWQQFVSNAEAGGLRTEQIGFETRESPDVGADDFELVGSASLLVAVLDGTARDMFVHFLCGCVMAKPDVGVIAPRLKRRILLLPRPDQRVADLVADSAVKCREVKVIRPDRVLTETRQFAAEYRRWAGLDV